MTDKDMSLLCATWVMAWATIAAALAAIVSALFARKAVSDQAKNFAQQIADYRLALSADTALKFDASFNDPKFQKIRSKAAHALLTQQNEEDAEDVFDFFDSVGLFVRFRRFERRDRIRGVFPLDQSLLESREEPHRSKAKGHRIGMEGLRAFVPSSI